MKDLKKIAAPSALACPECGGGLLEIDDAKPPRLQCHTVHAYSLQSLAHGMKDNRGEFLGDYACPTRAGGHLKAAGDGSRALEQDRRGLGGPPTSRGG